MAIEKGTTKKNTTTAAVKPADVEPNGINTPTLELEMAPETTSAAPAHSGKGRQPGPRDYPSMQWADKKGIDKETGKPCDSGERRKAILLALRELQAEPVAAVSIDQLVAKLATREELQEPATFKGKTTDLTLAELLSVTNVRAEIHRWERVYWSKGLDMYAEKGAIITRYFDKDGEPVKEGTEGAEARELKGMGFPKLIAGRKVVGELNFDLEEI